MLTQVQPRRAIHQLYEATLRETYGDGVLAARIPDAADYPEAIAHRLPITHYKPRSAAARAAMALAEEVLERMARSAADHRGEAA